MTQKKTRIHEGDVVEILSGGEVKPGDTFTLKVKAYRLRKGKTVLHPVGTFDAQGRYSVHLTPRRRRRRKTG